MSASTRHGELLTMKKGLFAPLAAVLFAGCGGTTTTVVQTVQATPRTTAAQTTSAEPEAAGETTPAQPQIAGVGDALTLKGYDVTMRVVVLDVTDPLAGGEYDEPDGRFVGVKVKLTNVGDTAYSDSPSNGATLITRGDEQADPTLLTGGDCSGSFSSSAKIAPGASRVGCIPFEVAAGKRIKTFQFTLNSGFGDETGEWRVAGAKPAAAAAAKPAAAPAAAAEPASARMTACDANISVDAGTTTCAFAGNVFYEYWSSGRSSGVSAYSAAAGTFLSTTCTPGGGDVTCTTSDGGLVRFPQSAVDVYTQSAADAYAASHDVGR